jgi:hypothetical protein
MTESDANNSEREKWLAEISIRVRELELKEQEAAATHAEVIIWRQLVAPRSLHMALEHECGVELEPDDSVATVGQMIDAMLVAMNQATKRATTLKIAPKASEF